MSEVPLYDLQGVNGDLLATQGAVAMGVGECKGDRE